MERKKIIVLNGVHGSGKTTYGRMLEVMKPETYAFFPEIGGQLRAEVDYNALQSGIDFDQEVLRREEERDQEILRCPAIPLIETWHIGNLAYIMERSPSLVDPARRKLERKLEDIEPLAVLLSISWATFKQRVTEKIVPEEMDTLIDFYHRILTNLLTLYEEYEIHHVSVQNDGTLEESCGQMEAALGEILITSE